MVAAGALQQTDFLAWVIAEIERARVVADLAVDRVDALLQIQVVATEAEARLKRPLAVEDVFYGVARDEAGRARLQALARRITGDHEEET